jgi:hypothetical protein
MGYKVRGFSFQVELGFAVLNNFPAIAQQRQVLIGSSSA